MRYFVAVAVLFLSLTCLEGCTWQWQANKSSEAVDINPFAGPGEPVISPSNGPGYMNGVPQDMRTRR